MKAELFQSEIIKLDKPFVSINSGDIHRKVGGYPSNNHRMKTCCEVMYSLMGENDNLVESPESGYGASLTIEYKLIDQSKYLFNKTSVID
ncbi:hypothetical protein [Vallitalea guaymasensis]|uniref:hypothetical protein n=1 Tax=Vallitalea guaymasensis TaxID=1185412 RepID=UPI002357BEE5|nr:hypothetical protein [Vallitalea guaymasensis]